MQFNSRWLSDGIADSYKEWYNKEDARTKTKYVFSTPSLVLIKSPTGTGKTTFILNTLVPYAAEKGRNILYLSNRSALSEQLKLAAKEHYFEVRPKIVNGIDEFEYNDFGNRILIMNYQALGKYNIKYLKSLNPYYVIFDEAHFFVEDSLFNKKTFSYFKKTLTSFPNSALIFMTATPENFNMIFDECVPKAINTHKFPDLYDLISYKNIIKYENTYSVANHKVIAYCEKNEILFKIRQSPKGQKWLIFVNSKKDGKEFLDKIHWFTNKTAQLLNADNKKSSAWNMLIQKNKFKSDVLIVTRVIDNGINIHDPKLKHIVLPFCTETDFKQMLGRRRTTDNEIVHIYVEDISIQKINSKFNQVRISLNILNNIDYINSLTPELQKDQTEIFKNTLARGKRKSFTNYISVKKNGKLIYNPLACHKLTCLMDFYSTLKQEYKNNPDFYLIHIKQWLKYTKSINYIFSDDCDSFIEFLEHFNNIPICDEDTMYFYNAFQYYYKRHCVKEFIEDKATLTKALSIRKGRTQRKSTMNKSLKLLNLPYEIKKENSCWVLRKTE